MNVENTQIPWELEIEKDDTVWEYKIKNKSGIHIATMNKYRGERQVDAMLIIRTVNSHRKLIESLSKIKGIVEKGGSYEKLIIEEIENAIRQNEVA